MEFKTPANHLIEIFACLDEWMEAMSHEQYNMTELCIDELFEFRDTKILKESKITDKKLFQEILQICNRMIPFMVPHLPSFD
jgi:hypothetical protein